MPQQCWPFGLATAVQADELGSIKGKFVYDGDPAKIKLTQPVCNKDQGTCCKNPLPDESLVVDAKDKGIANVVVYLRSRPSKIDAATEAALVASPLVVDNTACLFKPHVAILFTKQKLVLKNSDDVGHNTNYTGTESFNALIPANDKVEKTLTQVENLPKDMNCNIHPWMGSKLLVRDNPYFAVSAADGTFEIKALPLDAGAEFVIWHEKCGFVKEVKFAGGAADAKGRFKLDLKAGAPTWAKSKSPKRC